MRHRRVALAVAALTLLGVAACGDDSDDKGTPAFVTPGASAGPSGPAAPTGSAAPGGSASPGAKPTEGTATQKPPKKGGGANQGPVGRGAGESGVLSSAGLGPYALGVAQSELKSAALIGTVSTEQGCGTAKGLSEYARPTLAFSGGKLQRIAVTSTAVTTPTGAKVGTSYPKLKGMYPSGKQLDNWVGAKAWFTLDGGNALLFRIEKDKVAGIEAGPGQTLQFHYTDKQGC
ncbi:hypothetical protein Asp14428_52010 [Actinoplanes sp. NBRC 14428]|uniref:Lipoprotein n=1 Tax=Pseudosporangium ferrugineum TaxID=439699 RepID=A0A2T0S6B1_9ACTN|nr:hypothetical protein [Pseudosporangium ferrugineum]PRY28813.1 hypothetical protein CLV70_107116 [Pseudosporangium ferrugineum]BCJ53726.1 hypothetical protein Asp14428_52010 [Actinoplanes sp. NBRC 14428]